MPRLTDAAIVNGTRQPTAGETACCKRILDNACYTVNNCLNCSGNCSGITAAFTNSIGGYTLSAFDPNSPTYDPQVKTIILNGTQVEPDHYPPGASAFGPNRGVGRCCVADYPSCANAPTSP